MNKEELVKEVAKKAKVSQKAAADVIGATIDTIQKTVSKGKKVTLVGFGTFEARKRAARKAATLKQAKKLKSLQKQFLFSQQAKNSKN
jgi:DNA-binding protein HU-beta